MWKLISVVKDVDLQAMPTSIFLNDDDDDDDDENKMKSSIVTMLTVTT